MIDPDFGMTIDKSEIQTGTDIHIRDKNLLYENRDKTEIVTMYLTVSRGNSAENTDHSWEEINTYSVYDYERMGVERYKVAGLLQVGDENGLVPGELGYGQWHQTARYRSAVRPPAETRRKTIRSASNPIRAIGADKRRSH